MRGHTEGSLRIKNKSMTASKTITMSNTNGDNNIMRVRGHKSKINHCCSGASGPAHNKTEH